MIIFSNSEPFQTNVIFHKLDSILKLEWPTVYIEAL